MERVNRRSIEKGTGTGEGIDHLIICKFGWLVIGEACAEIEKKVLLVQFSRDVLVATIKHRIGVQLLFQKGGFETRVQGYAEAEIIAFRVVQHVAKFGPCRGFESGRPVNAQPAMPAGLTALDSLHGIHAGFPGGNERRTVGDGDVGSLFAIRAGEEQDIGRIGRGQGMAGGSHVVLQQGHIRWRGHAILLALVPLPQRSRIASLALLKGFRR